jgi:hypothetical protein
MKDSIPLRESYEKQRKRKEDDSEVEVQEEDNESDRAGRLELEAKESQ